MNQTERKYLEIVQRGTQRVFIVPQANGTIRWFVQGIKGQGGHVKTHDEAINAIRHIR